jgi:hypothetical protein
MTYKSLMNKKMTEVALYDYIAKILQFNFSKYQNVETCILLSDIDSGLVEVIEIRFFTRSTEDIQQKRKFLFSGPLNKCYAFARFHGDFYELDLMGHFVSKFGDVYTTELKCVRMHTSDVDRAFVKMPDFDFLMKAFGDITDEIVKKSS